MKHRLLTPGPTPVPEETLLELARPMIYHRTPEFRQMLAEVLKDLQYVFCTENIVIPLTSSGTGAMEAALANVCPPGSKAICLVAGKFGERWRNICQAMGIEAVNLVVPYGHAVTAEQLAQALRDHSDALAVCSTLSETSTGVAHDIKAFGKLVAATPAAFLVDAVSGLGAMECRSDDWKIDICVTGSQKSLMMPPGLAFLTVSGKAWKLIEKNPNPRTFYFDLKKAKKSFESSGDTPFTIAHTLIRAMRHSLKMIREEGLENILAKHALNAAAARAGMIALGMTIFPSPPNNAVTVGKVAGNIDSSAVLSKLEKKYGLKLANGQDVLKGKVIRLAHMGHIDQFDILAALAGLELVLIEMGQPIEPGKGVAAAQRVWSEAVKK